MLEPIPNATKATTPCNLLRGYQARAIELLRESLRTGHRRPVLKLPTGAGKTKIAGQIIRMALDRGKRAIFVVPRISLIEQTVASFEREGISHIGVIQGQNHRTDASALVQIASERTLSRRQIPPAGIVLIDEVHLQSVAIAKWIADPEWATVPFIGLTATPWARGMGKIWDDLIAPVGITELIEAGYLSKFRVLAPSAPDLSDVKTTAGDFNESGLSEVCDTPEIVGNVIDTWFQHAKDRPTLVYGVDRRHAQHLQERFIEAGAPAEYVDCFTEMYEREEIFQRFRDGTTRIICNVATLDTGIDLDVRCICDCRPTKSRIRFVQTIGRALRVAPGKDHALLLDHAGNHLRLGLVTEIDFPKLDMGEPGKSLEFVKDKDRKPARIRLCPECHCVQAPGARLCPQCGHVFHAVTMVHEREGALIELGATRRGQALVDNPEYWHGCFAFLANERGYKPGWAAHKFFQKFGTWPKRRFPELCEPDIKVKNWIKSRQVAFAKSKKRA
jgi:superfamily II DNA or RNA helicase